MQKTKYWRVIQTLKTRMTYEKFLITEDWWICLTLLHQYQFDLMAPSEASDVAGLYPVLSDLAVGFSNMI